MMKKGARRDAGHLFLIRGALSAAGVCVPAARPRRAAAEGGRGFEKLSGKAFLPAENPAFLRRLCGTVRKEAKGFAPLFFGSGALKNAPGAFERRGGRIDFASGVFSGRKEPSALSPSSFSFSRRGGKRCIARGWRRTKGRPERCLRKRKFRNTRRRSALSDWSAR